MNWRCIGLEVTGQLLLLTKQPPLAAGLEQVFSGVWLAASHEGFPPIGSVLADSVLWNDLWPQQSCSLQQIRHSPKIGIRSEVVASLLSIELHHQIASYDWNSAWQESSLWMVSQHSEAAKRQAIVEGEWTYPDNPGWTLDFKQGPYLADCVNRIFFEVYTSGLKVTM